MAKKLPIANDDVLFYDDFVIEEDGSITAWTCAINDLDLAPDTTAGSERLPLGECAAPRRECPRGFTNAFECRPFVT